MTAKKNQFLSNLVGVGIVDGLNLVVPLLTLPFLSRSLGPEQFGIYLLVLTIITFGYTFVDYSSNYIGVRDVAKAKSKEERANIFYRHFGYRLSFCFLYLLIAFIASIFLYGLSQAYLILLVSGPFLIGYTLMNAWFFIALSKTYLLAFLSFLSKLVHLIVVIMIVEEPSNLDIALYSLSFPNLIAGVVLFSVISQQFPVKAFSYRSVLSEVSKGKNVFIGLLAPNLYNAIPLMVVAAWFSKYEYGILAAAIKVTSVILIVQNILAKAVYPILSKGSNQYLFKLLLGNSLTSAIMILALFLFGDFAIELYLGADYKESFILVLVLSVSTLFVGIANTYGQGYLLAQSKDKIYRNCTVNSSVLSGVIVIVSVYFFGVVGFVLSMVLSRALLASSYYLAYKREVKVVEC